MRVAARREQQHCAPHGGTQLVLGDLRRGEPRDDGEQVVTVDGRLELLERLAAQVDAAGRNAASPAPSPA